MRQRFALSVLYKMTLLDTPINVQLYHLPHVYLVTVLVRSSAVRLVKLLIRQQPRDPRFGQFVSSSIAHVNLTLREYHIPTTLAWTVKPYFETKMHNNKTVPGYRCDYLLYET